jgi:hypothetical protein
VHEERVQGSSLARGRSEELRRIVLEGRAEGHEGGMPE